MELERKTYNITDNRQTYNITDNRQTYNITDNRQKTKRRHGTEDP
jgi:hypothetical protein